MFFSQLSMLKESFPSDVLNAFDQYLASLTPTAASLITAYKLSLATEINYYTCLQFLKACLDIGFMDKHYALLCPECGKAIKLVDSFEESICAEPEYCHKCDEIIKFDETNFSNSVELVFSLRDVNYPFVSGQQPVDCSLDTELSAVLSHGNLSDAVQLRIVEYDDLFSISENDCQSLLKQIAEIKQPKKQQRLLVLH